MAKNNTSKLEYFYLNSRNLALYIYIFALYQRIYTFAVAKAVCCHCKCGKDNKAVQVDASSFVMKSIRCSGPLMSVHFNTHGVVRFFITLRQH